MTGFANGLGQRAASAMAVVLVAVLSAVLLLGGATLLLGVICALLVLLLVLSERRQASAPQDVEIGDVDEAAATHAQLAEAERQLEVQGDRLKDELKRAARLQATLEELGRTVDDLRDEDREKSQRLDVLHRVNARHERNAELVVDMLAIAVEEAGARGVLQLDEPAVLLERLVGVARAELAKQSDTDVGLAAIIEDGHSRRVVNTAGVRRDLLEDVSRPLVDVATKPGQTLYPVRLPPPFDDRRLIAIFDGRPTKSDESFVDVVASVYANTLLLVTATSGSMHGRA